MAKTDSVYARVEPKVKEEAEAIFFRIGCFCFGSYQYVLSTSYSNSGTSLSDDH